MIQRHPEWNMDHRRLLHGIDFAKGTIEIDGVAYALRDTHLPTIDPKDPYALSAEERTCIDRLKHAFLSSQKLWGHLKFMVGQGSMYLDRDDNLIFHGCVPCDEFGGFLPMYVDGQPAAGRALFDA